MIPTAVWIGFSLSVDTIKSCWITHGKVYAKWSLDLCICVSVMVSYLFYDKKFHEKKNQLEVDTNDVQFISINNSNLNSIDQSRFVCQHPENNHLHEAPSQESILQEKHDLVRTNQKNSKVDLYTEFASRNSLRDFQNPERSRSDTQRHIL